MIILTERLDLIASNIEIGEKVADIGTDHGYLPLYLFEKKISPKIILTDVSKGSLNKAQENCKRLYPDADFDLREGDGLEPLKKAEVDTVVIAGMGGILISEILQWDISKAISYKKYIFQPRNNSGYLRRYLYERGFRPVNLSLALENKRIGEVMVYSSPDDYKGPIPSDEIDDVVFEYPDELISDASSYTKEYLETCLQNEESIKEKIAGNLDSDSSQKAEEGIHFRDKRIARIKDLLQKLEV